jgi:hypothetical protein
VTVGRERDKVKPNGEKRMNLRAWRITSAARHCPAGGSQNPAGQAFPGFLPRPDGPESRAENQQDPYMV